MCVCENCFFFSFFHLSAILLILLVQAAEGWTGLRKENVYNLFQVNFLAIPPFFYQFFVLPLSIPPPLSFYSYIVS